MNTFIYIWKSVPFFIISEVSQGPVEAKTKTSQPSGDTIFPGKTQSSLCVCSNSKYVNSSTRKK